MSNKKSDKPKDNDPFGLLEGLNSSKLDTILLAWNVIGQTDAVDARVTAVQRTGLTISATCRSAYTGAEYTEESTHEFPHALESGGAVGKELETLKAKSRIVSWPPGFGALISAAILVGCLSCTAEIKVEVTSIYVQTIRMVSMLLLRSIFNARVVVGLILVAHIIEGLFVASVCRRLKFTKFQTATWFSMVVLLGYPCTSRILFLEQVYNCTEKAADQIESKKAK